MNKGIDHWYKVVLTQGTFREQSRIYARVYGMDTVEEFNSSLLISGKNVDDLLHCCRTNLGMRRLAAKVIQVTTISRPSVDIVSNNENEAVSMDILREFVVGYKEIAEESKED